MRVFLGVDTSSYTTSMCLLGEDGRIMADERKTLEVASGSRGLRQSEALFQHAQNLPKITEKLAPHLAEHDLKTIGVSVRPRPQEDSYLPVFLPGFTLAQSLSHILGIPCHPLTHQETHLWSGIGSASGPSSARFLAIHLSGGTTELTLVERDQQTCRLRIELMGGTSDLHAGQFVDRLGVKMGLPFPAGPSMEQLAYQTSDSLPVPTFHRDGMVSFSGPLTALERMLGRAEPRIIARACFKCIVRTLLKWIGWAEGKTACRDLLIVGGVAANKIIRLDLQEALPNWRLYFATPVHSVDNAYGAALSSALVSGYLSLPFASREDSPREGNCDDTYFGQ